MTHLNTERVQQAILDVGGGHLDASSLRRTERGFQALTELSDEELAFALTLVRTGGPGASQQLESIRESVRSLIRLRISQREADQADALRETVDQLRQTESKLDRAIDLMLKLLPFASKLPGVGE